MKRFWDAATPERIEGGWRVLLDGKPMRLPGGAVLLLPTEQLAHAVAAEWQAAGEAKGGEMSFADVALTRIAGTAQERVVPNAAAVAEEVARYGASDLLCYRADAPPELARRQDAAWQPWLDWAWGTFGAHLRVTAGIVHIPQESHALAALAGAVEAVDPFTLAALGVAVPALGSLVLGLALAAGRLDAAGAHALATLDERFQEESWGMDAEAEARRAAVAADLAAAEAVMRAVRA